MDGEPATNSSVRLNMRSLAGTQADLPVGDQAATLLRVSDIIRNCTKSPQEVRMPTAALMRGLADVQPLPTLFSETKQGQVWGEEWVPEQAALRSTLKTISYSVNWWSRGESNP